MQRFLRVTAVSGVDTVARAGVVNRTHRVVRERAKVMQARRSHMRSLMVPLILCSVLLILTVVAVWSGLYQYQATEAAETVQADVAACCRTPTTTFWWCCSGLCRFRWRCWPQSGFAAAHKGRESGTVR